MSHLKTGSGMGVLLALLLHYFCTLLTILAGSDAHGVFESGKETCAVGKTALFCDFCNRRGSVSQKSARHFNALLPNGICNGYAYIGFEHGTDIVCGITFFLRDHFY